MDCVWHPIEFSAEIESRSRSRCRNFNESNSISEVSEFVDVVHKSQIIQIISIVFFLSFAPQPVGCVGIANKSAIEKKVTTATL